MLFVKVERRLLFCSITVGHAREARVSSQLAASRAWPRSYSICDQATPTMSRAGTVRVWWTPVTEVSSLHLVFASSSGCEGW